MRSLNLPYVQQPPSLPFRSLNRTAVSFRSLKCCCRQNGSLVITARNGQNHSASSLCLDGSGEVCRVFARSDTGGQTWAQTWHVPYRVLPAARCEAAMTSIDLPGHATGLLLFGAPMNTTTGDRTNYTVHTSLDGKLPFPCACCRVCCRACRASASCTANLRLSLACCTLCAAGGLSWAWAAALYPSTPAAVAWTGYSAITAIGEPQRVSATAWRVDVGAAFQLGHNLGKHVEGGGYDMAWARSSVVVGGA